MERSHTALCSWLHHITYICLPKLPVKFTPVMQKGKPYSSPPLSPVHKFSGRDLSSISRTGQLAEDALLHLSVVFSCSQVLEQYLDATHTQCLTHLLHRDPTSEIIPLMGFASSAESLSDIQRAKGNIWPCWWAQQFAKRLLGPRAALTTHHTRFPEQNLPSDVGILYIIRNAKHYATSWLNDEVP